jgi:hypothetical protein
MKILRKIGKAIGSAIFVLALSTAILAISLTKLTEHDNIKGLATDLIGAQIAKEVDNDTLTQIHQQLLEGCKTNETIHLSKIIGENVTIKCEDVEKSTPEGLTNLFANALFDSIYYKKYYCSFIECLQIPSQNKLILFVSLEAHSFFKNCQYILLIVSGVGLAVMLVSIETWWNILKSVGIALLSISLPLIILILFKDRIFSLSANLEAVTSIIDQIFGPISKISLVMLIVGIVLTISGYILRHYRKVKVEK